MFSRLVVEYMVGMYCVREPNGSPTPAESVISQAEREVSAVRTLDDVGYSHGGWIMLLAFSTLATICWPGEQVRDFRVLRNSGNSVRYAYLLRCHDTEREPKDCTGVNDLLTTLLPS